MTTREENVAVMESLEKAFTPAVGQCVDEQLVLDLVWRASDAVNEFTRKMLRHRGFCRQAFPAIGPPLRTLADWESRGWPRALLHKTGAYDNDRPLYALEDPEKPFYEIAESRIFREEKERRLALRQMDRHEWRSHRRYLKRTRHTSDLYRKYEEAAYQVMGELVAAIMGSFGFFYASRQPRMVQFFVYETIGVLVPIVRPEEPSDAILP